MKAISVRAPWWWFILYGGKDIENRDRSSPCSQGRILGTVWLHASKWWGARDIALDLDDAVDMAKRSGVQFAVPDLTRLRSCGGMIVGSVQIVDYVEESASPWFMGDVGLLLRNPIPLETPVPMLGMLGFFDVPDDLIGDAR